MKWIDFSHAKKLVGTDTKDDGVLIGLVSFINFLQRTSVVRKTFSLFF